MTTLEFPVTNFQLQSPLFGVLPGEIRNEIFALALMPHEDKEEAYPENSYWFRPGFEAPRKSNSVLLRTCKAAYAEGQKVFLKELEWAFWFDRGPDGRSGNLACIQFFKSLTPKAAEALQKVRFFTQMYWLENGCWLGILFRLPQFRPTQLTITIRYSDWWWWEDDAPLTMQEIWLQSFLGTPGLRELKVEYETRVPKKGEMMAIVQRNKKYKLPVRRDNGGMDDWEGYLSAEKTKLEEWTWKGTSKLEGKTWDHLAKSDILEYVVVTDTWKFVDEQIKPEHLGRHATGLRWRDFDEDEEIYGEGGFNYGHIELSDMYSEDEEIEGMYSAEESDDDEDDREEEDGNEQSRYERRIYRNVVAAYESELDGHDEVVARHQMGNEYGTSGDSGLSAYEQAWRDSIGE